MSKMSEMDVMVNDALHMVADGFPRAEAVTTVSNLNNLNSNECDYLLDAVVEAVAAGQEPVHDDYEEDYDYLLERQEMEDFAQDGDFENMGADEIL